MENKFVVLEENDSNLNISYDNVAVVSVLYYEDDIDWYYGYLKNIPDSIDLYILSSNADVLLKYQQLLYNKKNTFFINKQNRGRDLSGLLVSFKEYFSKYSYICFLHDKTVKHLNQKRDLELWVDNLWGNMLSTKGYIDKALDLLQNQEYGVLLPPKPVGRYFDSMYTDPWDNDYENVVKLASELNLNIDIKKEDREFVSLGSVFWCQTKALEKLLKYDWKYEDFSEEPMPNDGTISHAIERIVGFVAIDAGYKIATIMNSQYSAKMVSLLQEKLQFTYDWLWNKEGIKNTYQLEKYDEEMKSIESIFRNKNVFIYGAGDYGIQYLHKLLKWGYIPKGFVVSDGQRTKNEIENVKVYELSEIKVLSDNYFIVATTLSTQDEICNVLKEKGYVHYYRACI